MAPCAVDESDSPRGDWPCGGALSEPSTPTDDEYQERVAPHGRTSRKLATDSELNAQSLCRTSRKLTTDSVLHVQSSSLLARRGLRVSTIVPEAFKGYRQALLERGYSLGAVLGRSSANQGFTVVAAEKEGRRFAAKGTGEHETCGVLTATLRGEYDILRDLSHPGIVHAEELIEGTGGCAMVMELCRGVCVERLMPKGTTLSGLGRHAVLGALLDAVAYLHREQIAHRDLHALNVMVDTQTLDLGTAGGLHVGGAIKIVDFGSALRITAGGDLAAIGRFGDTACLDILPPARGSSGDCPFACDVFAVGLLAAGLAVGRPLLSADVVCMEVLRVPERSLSLGELGIEHLHSMLSLSPEARPPALACAESLPPAEIWLA